MTDARSPLGASYTEARDELERIQRGDPTPRVTFEPAEREVIDAEAAKYLVGMTFTSRSDKALPHIVTRHFDGSLTCTCQAHALCWGIKAFKQVAGIQ